MRLVVLIVLTGGLGAVGVVFVIWYFLSFRRTPRPDSHTPQTPDAEKDARAKFLRSSDTVVDDASIQPNKRNVKPGDR
jgi:hypothetical protein